MGFARLYVTRKFDWNYQTESRAGTAWPQRLLAARPGHRRLRQRQRAGLPARQPARLRPLGAVRRARLVLRRLPAGLPQAGDLPRRRTASSAARTGRCRSPRCRNPPSAARPSSRPARALGFARNRDNNGEWFEGVAPNQLNVHKGRRWSPAVGYLRPAMKRPNLRVETERLALRLTFAGNALHRRRRAQGRRRRRRPGPRGARCCSRPARSRARSC